MKAIAVFCGASFNGDPIFKESAELLAEELVKRDITLVFGGGNIGLMGIIADAVLDRGGRVIGVMPEFLLQKEIGHPRLTKMYIVENMHQRKQKMNELADGSITLPGGFGTLEEFFEVLTWLQLGLHQKPVALLNVNGFYDFLLKQLDVMVEQNLLLPFNRKLVLSSSYPLQLLENMQLFKDQLPDGGFSGKNLI
jgi:uncharacterized protein (TIGR00730 family)